MFDILKDALTFDPLDCYPNASYPPMRDNLELALDKTKNRNTKLFPRTIRFVAFVRRLVVNLPSLLKSLDPIEAKHCFFGLTHNQRTSLKPVVTMLNESLDKSATLYSGEDVGSLIKASNFWATLYLPALLVRMLGEKGYRRKSFRWAFDEYWRAYGLYILFRCWFRKKRPETITVSNDHSLFPCVITKAAQDEGIPTFYLQHACVTEKFPPLRMDFALLDGVDALEKYSAVSSGETKIFLVGVPKFDAFAEKINHSTRCRSVGVCFSLADDLDRSLQLLKGLSALEGVEIIVRPHMGMSAEAKQAFENACKKYNYALSLHAEEHSFDFLSRIDVLISGTSAIALEAVLLNVTSLNYVLNTESSDWYGFVSNALTVSTESVDELRAWIEDLKQNRPNIQLRAQRYCATISTDYAGRSSELAAEIIGSGGQKREGLTEFQPSVFAVPCQNASRSN